MDSFTEGILARARERKKLLDGYTDVSKMSPLSPKKAAASQPNLSSAESPSRCFKTNSEGNLPAKISRQNSRTRISSEVTSLTSSPKSQLKTLNIQNDNFNMEIKVSSADNVRVEVQIEEHDESSEEHSNDEEEDTCSTEGGLRPDAKYRLNRLGKLYAGGDDAEISSPIHRTEARLHEEAVASMSTKSDISKRGLSKLADLADNINKWEDDLTPVKPKDPKEIPVNKAKKTWKPPAPQPPQVKNNTPRRSPMKARAPSPPKIVSEKTKSAIAKAASNSPTKTPNSVQWDRKVLDSLESQGFTRTDSSTRLVYEYPEKQEKENQSGQINLKSRSKIAEKTAVFEASSPRASLKDPALLSLSERKALFEKNKSTPLVPKAAFGMATPIKTPKMRAPSPKPIKESPAKSTPFIAKTEIKLEPVVKPASPTKSVEVKSVAGGIRSTVAALFENKSTISQEQIENGIREQKQREMDMLLNRFHKNEAQDAIEEVEEEDMDEIDEKTAMIREKAVKVVNEEGRRSSSNKRHSKGDSPKVQAVLSEVKRIKVVPQKAGRLYPSLTDIESVTETENDTEAGDTRPPSPNDSSFAESDDANTSFGRDILQAVCQKNQSANKRQIANESSGSDLSNILDESDDYIDEALAYNGGDGPTPPKQGRQSPVQPSNSFNYQSYKPQSRRDSSDLPTHVVDGDNVLPLTHTVSFYRKQQQLSTTPIRQISRQPPTIEEAADECPQDAQLINDKLRSLQQEVNKQEMIISQTSQALNLCNSTFEFMGSTEQVEAERVLLVATHRRQAALHELQRLKVENTLRPNIDSTNTSVEKGTLVISKIVLPLKKKYVTALAAAGGKGHHVVCLVKYGEQVFPTQLVSTIVHNAKNPELELNVPGSVKLSNVYGNFTISLEVYSLQAQEEILPHEVKYHIKKASGKSTPKKNKQDSRLTRPLRESPAGPQVVRSPTFALMGYAVFSVHAVSKKQFTLNNTPTMSPLEGTVEMCISCELAVSVEHHGFLTMFEDVSGFGAWHRRWCLLKGNVLSYWKYPDDEKKTPPINSISLSSVTNRKVGPVQRDVCARPHTFLVETERMAHSQDRNTLVTICKGDKTIVRHLLSADSKQETIEWINKFNKALGGLQMWK